MEVDLENERTYAVRLDPSDENEYQVLVIIQRLIHEQRATFREVIVQAILSLGEVKPVYQRDAASRQLLRRMEALENSIRDQRQVLREELRKALRNVKLGSGSVVHQSDGTVRLDEDWMSAVEESVLSQFVEDDGDWDESDWG
jgi:hypothetical protein